MEHRENTGQVRAFLQAAARAIAIRMRNADDLARSIRARATRSADPRNSALLHRLADEAAQIRCFGPAARHR